jgi:L-aminopeptidase/D-esterase-like protein
MMDLSPFGLVVGHASDVDGATGLTVIRGDTQPMRAGYSIVGRATGSRELLAASANHLMNGRVDAILLTGGSAYGLDAAGGVMRWLEARGRGFSVGGGVVPIVPAAVVFDLAPLGRFDARPTADMAFAACDAATVHVREGCVGAGTGTTVGKVLGPAGAMKSGFGCSIATSGNGATSVVAMVVTNAFGDVRDAAGSIVAGARDARGGFVDTARVLARGNKPTSENFDELAKRNTTLAVVATNVPLQAADLTQLANAASAALFKRITPVGTAFDGDIIFATCPMEGMRGDARLMTIEALAVGALEVAVERSVTLARGRDGIPGYADRANDNDH